MEYTFDFLKERNESIVKDVIEKLHFIDSKAFDFTFEDVAEGKTHKFVTKRDLARFMVNRGLASNNKEVYDRFIGRDCEAYIPIKKMYVETAIRLIHECGGIAVLAHPGIYGLKSYSDYFILFSELDNLDLDGLETLTLRQNAQETQMFEELAKSFKFLKTCGTDFHRKPDDEGPGIEVSEDFFAPFLDKLGIPMF